MKKKILSTLLATSILTTAVVFPNFVNADDNKLPDSKYIDACYGLGIFTDDTEDKNAYMTRGEFAKVLCNILGTENENEIDTQWSQNFFGSLYDVIDEKHNVTVAVDYYDDVDSTSEYYDYINTVTTFGLMNGVGNSNFNPDGEISTLQICTTLANLMGYGKYAEYFGGYPNGYISVANGVKMADGVGCTNKSASYYDAARLLYNCFNVEVCNFTVNENEKGFATQQGKTFLSEIMEISVTEGIMTDNGITSLAGVSEVGKSNVVVANIKLSNTKANMRDLIGCNLKAYYTAEDEKLLYAEKTGKNKELVISADEFEAYKNNVITYTPTGSSRTQTVKFASDAPVIYNGIAQRSYDNNTFNFEEGTIRLIAPKGESSYSTVVVEKYDNWYVSQADIANNKIYNAAHDDDDYTDDTVMDLTTGMEEGTVRVYKADGTASDFSKIKLGNVLSVARSTQDDQIVKIIISEESKLALKVASIFYDDDAGKQRIEFSDESEYYVTSSYYNAAEVQNIRLNDEVNIYVNAFGNIAWMEKSGANEYTVGYLMKISKIDDMLDEPAVKVKVFNEDGKVETLYFADKVQYRNADKYTRKDDETIYELIKDYYGIIAYSKNDEDEIKYIETPSEKRNNNGALQVMYNDPTGGVLNYNGYGAWRFFDNDKIIFNSGSVIFKVPTAENRENEKLYSIGASFVVNQKYNVQAYGFDGTSGYSPYLVYVNEAENVGDFTISGSYKSWDLVFIKDIYQGINSDEEAGAIIIGSKFGPETSLTEVELFCLSDEGEDPTIGVQDTLKSGKTYNIQKGDIIRFKTDSTGERVNKVELFFRLNGENQQNPNGPKGFLAGTIGYFDGDNLEKIGYRTNPYAQEDNLAGNGFGGLRNAVTGGGNKRLAYGYVYSYKDNIIRYTTQDIVSGEFDETDDRYFTEYWIPYRTSITITKEGKNYTVTSGLNNMKTYRENGRDCSRIITGLMSSLTAFTIIINSDI